MEDKDVAGRPDATAETWTGSSLIGLDGSGQRATTL